MATIYISSTFEDLKDCRQEVYNILRKMRHDVIAMEDYVAADQRPLTKCLADVAACEIYVGLFAWRYGYLPTKDNPQKQSITEREFREAVKQGKPCLVFLLHEKAPWPYEYVEKGRGAKRLEALRAELATDYTASFFSTAQELAGLVSVAVTNLVQKTAEFSSRRNATGLGLPINVPDLPAHFLPRPEDLEALKHAVLAGGNKSVALTGVRRVGVHGMGGIGKSVLAAALARDEEVQRAFPDGVLWLAVGQTPSLSLLQAQLAAMLGDTSPAFEDLQRGKVQLSKLLADKTRLLIVDDLWDVAHAAAFDVLGPRCKLLLTSRDASLITALGAEEHRLDVLSDTQAQSLLAQWTNQKVHTLPVVAFNVMRECGNLPLALAVSAALVRDGTSWTDVLEALQQADLAFLNYPHGSIMKSLKVSVEALPPAEAQHYLDLAVFPSDEAVPEAAVVRLWCEAHSKAGRNERHARRLLTTLERKALLHLDGIEPHRTMSLHDLQYDYIHATHDNLPALHTKLVEAYRHQCLNGWASGPNDGYFFQHLARHLMQANRHEELRQLLCEFDWLRAKLAATNLNALLADYEVLSDDPRMRLVQGALRLAAHVLARDPHQLAGQLTGRLLSQSDQGIQELLAQARRQNNSPYLYVLQPTLTPPGGPLRPAL